MQIFLHNLDGTQTIANVESNQSLELFVNNNNLQGLRLISQGSILTE